MQHVLKGSACRVLAVSLPCASRVFAVSCCSSAVLVSSPCNVFAVILHCICNVLALLLSYSTVYCVLWLATFLCCAVAVFTHPCTTHLPCAFQPCFLLRPPLPPPPDHWTCRPVSDGPVASDPLRAIPQATFGDAAKPCPATWQGLTGLSQTHHLVAQRGEQENFRVSAWHYGVLIAVLEHHMKARRVGTINPSKRKSAHPALPNPTAERGAIHVDPPIQHVALLGQVRVELPPWMRASLRVP